LDRFNRIKAIAMQQYMTECVPMVSWHTQSFPTCNAFHEMDMIGTTPLPLYSDAVKKSSFPTWNDDISLLSDQGSWRSVWKVQRYLWWNHFNNATTTLRSNHNHDNATNSTLQEETLVLKLLKFQRRDFDEESYHHHRMDAM
jgi:hypothetical protein